VARRAAADGHVRHLDRPHLYVLIPTNVLGGVQLWRWALPVYNGGGGGGGNNGGGGGNNAAGAAAYTAHTVGISITALLGVLNTVFLVGLASNAGLITLPDFLSGCAGGGGRGGRAKTAGYYASAVNSSSDYAAPPLA